ncbi:MAG: hypothetical protein FWE61_04760 [Micrococcales bacterium]|nr:hypothetical protein [Micrococcales bacterium]
MTVDQVVAVYWAADCRTDTRTGDARKRSLPWLTGPAAENAAAEVREAHNAAWLELCSHQGWFTVTSTDAAAAFEFPRDTATRAHRARIVTLTPTGSDGWSGTEVIYVAQFELVNDGRGWLVLDMDYARSAGLPTGEGWE